MKAVFYVILSIVICSYLISINYEVNRKGSIQNIDTNLSEIIYCWSVIALISTAAIIGSILVILIHVYPNLDVIKELLPKLIKPLTVLSGIMCLVSACVAWEYLGRNNMYIQKNIMVVITFGIVVGLAN